VTRRTVSILTLALLLPLASACSDDDNSGGGETSGSQPRTLEELADQDPRLTEITDPQGTGPVIGTEDGEDVWVSDAQIFCDGYWRVSDYKDQIVNLLDRGDHALLMSHIESVGPSAYDAAAELIVGISGGRDLDMMASNFVAASQGWADNREDLETIRERLERHNTELAGFDRAFAEVC
jgi:hypothetical protein